MKSTLTMLSLAILFIGLAMSTTAFSAVASPHSTSHVVTASKSHLRAIVSHNPPHIVVTQPAAAMSAPPKFTATIFSGDVQHEVQLSLPAKFTVSLMCDGGKVSYTLFDLGGNNGFGLPDGELEHRTFACDNAPHVLVYDLLLSTNVAIRVDRLTTVTVKAV